MMKKIISIMAGGVLLAATMSGCVDDNPTVIISGLMLPSDTCDAGTDSGFVIGGSQLILSAEDSALCEQIGADSMGNTFMVQFINNTTSESGWSSSSSGASGSTFEPDPSNRGAVLIKKIVLKCDNINGDSDACDRLTHKEIEINRSQMITSGGAYCANVTVSWSQFMDAETMNALYEEYGELDLSIDVYGKYADVGGLIKGSTSHGAYTLSIYKNGSSDIPNIAEHYQQALEGYNAVKAEYYKVLQDGKADKEELSKLSEKLTEYETAYNQVLNEYVSVCTGIAISNDNAE